MRTLDGIKHSEGLIRGRGDAEARFKRVVRALHDVGYFPTPSRIRYCCWKAERPTGQSRGAGGPSLNGRETRWRREVFEELGYRYVGDWTWRWRAPARADVT